MSCQGCKQNKLVFERRGFLAGLAFMGFRVKRGLLAGAWGLMGQTVEANDMQAEQLLSALHTIALWFRRDTGEFPSEKLIIGTLAQHKEHYEPGTWGYAWMSQVNFFAGEIMPGWKLKYTTDGKSFDMTLTGTIYTLRTSEENLHEQAMTGEDRFVPVDQFEKPVARRIKDLFRPVSFGSASEPGCTCNPNCTNTNPPCTGAECAKSCCSSEVQCSTALLPPPETCFFAYGKTGCHILYSPCTLFCGSSACNVCVKKILGGCCLGCQCPPGGPC